MTLNNYKNLFDKVRESTHLPDWLDQYKQNQWQEFEAKGFPTRQDEEWKYTSVKALKDAEFQMASQTEKTLSSDAQKYLDSLKHKIVFYNGLFQAELSQIPEVNGLFVSSLNEKIQKDEMGVKRILDQLQQTHSLDSLNLALLKDGVWVDVSRDVSLQDPLHIVYLFDQTNAPLMMSPLNVVLVNSGSSVAVVEDYISFADETTHFVNAKTVLQVKENAKLAHAQNQNLNNSSHLVLTTQANVEKGGVLETFALDQGCKLARHDLNIQLTGEGSHADLNGLYLTKGKQHVDHHSVVDHSVPRATSAQLYKGILDDESRAVFNGKVFVRQDAQETDSAQLNKNLLLSKKASVDTKPQLEIAADDVSCTHGATVGQINDEEMFYFESRGIPEELARRTLIEGFSKDVLLTIKNSNIQSYLMNQVQKKDVS